jgi:hypothetical protein
MDIPRNEESVRWNILAFTIVANIKNEVNAEKFWPLFISQNAGKNGGQCQGTCWVPRQLLGAIHCRLEDTEPLRPRQVAEILVKRQERLVAVSFGRPMQGWTPNSLVTANTGLGKVNGPHMFVH